MTTPSVPEWRVGDTARLSLTDSSGTERELTVILRTHPYLIGNADLEMVAVSYADLDYSIVVPTAMLRKGAPDIRQS